ncbi:MULTISPECIES: acyl carrier protein [Streptomyces]|uniref:Polyketide-8 synthase acyl carrier protein n=2 Tax=Streptomyces TaxID=1883 RepID=A0A1V0UJP1_STRVN|nr:MULTISPECIES: acyl carrier protein [Streptomyces]MYW78437.1 acyl carrier protein [Streptomyces sp. SID8369]NEA12255.1 acyl carrier protein [Streptomyces sp. SID10692]NEC40994.1 acyl carrier protein [Streptomyces sp. SID8016]ARF65327.1 polyketide-8 synthase acyl carrier protein [Streptomyces violaceoruber]KOU02888.1 polyketide-8 synthase acyl carrier protein [Streptomyces sp. NRRL F-2295]
MTNNTAAVLEKEDLRSTVADVLDVSESELTDDAQFVGDLGVDSLMALEVMVVLEKKYGVKLGESELKEVTCLQRAYDLLATKLKES